MIRIGLNESEKTAEINRYLEQHAIKKILVLYCKKFKPDFKLSTDVPIEYVEYADIIMYKFFYRLLEEITGDYLIVVDECMRTQNRSELTYNCAHHYLNQTSHRMIFEYFPFIEKQDDFMILLDFQDKGKHKGKGFSLELLRDEDVLVKQNPIRFPVCSIPVSPEQIEQYNRTKERLFDELGSKDPDTIPRHLHLLAGDFKKPFIQDNRLYVARNHRFKRANVAAYKDNPSEERNVIDFPHRRLDFNDYLKASHAREVVFLSTGLPVDEYYQSQFGQWLRRVGEFNAQAGLYRP